MSDRSTNRAPAADAGAPTAGVSPDDLRRLVAELRATVAAQERTIAQQRVAIASMQARSSPPAPAVEATAAASTQPAPSAAPPAARIRAATPIPGADFTVVFDGGSLGNPGQGYGSYQIVGAGGVVGGRRVEYGDGVTNNQAEYRTLIHALEDVRGLAGDAAPRTTVAVRGDSSLVVNQVTGRWKVKHPDLQPLHRQAGELLRAFGRTDVAWQPRAASVRVLGH